VVAAWKRAAKDTASAEKQRCNAPLSANVVAIANVIDCPGNHSNAIRNLSIKIAFNDNIFI